jgi:hypothetical protein
VAFQDVEESNQTEQPSAVKIENEGDQSYRPIRFSLVPVLLLSQVNSARKYTKPETQLSDYLKSLSGRKLLLRIPRDVTN